ncbi:hypothetical protein VTL71DRAFT_13596 [Oculimacula yallundae]|uniref:Uncharacterized protein n=1 Tax=Oculimacula yallundae TaxID=86028 RepID=A0ABR4CL92_9HELO
MRLRSSTSLEQAESSASEAEETMQEDNYSTQAVRGSPVPHSQSPRNRRRSPSPPLGQAGPSNTAPAHSHRGQQSYPETHHSGTDFLLYDSWHNDSADDFDPEEPVVNSRSPHIYSPNGTEPYDISNPSSQIPPAAPSPPPNDYGYRAQPDLSDNHRRNLTPIQTSPPIQRWTQDRGAWNPAAPMSAEERKERLTEDIPDLDLQQEWGYDDKMKRDLKDLSGEGMAEEGRKRKRPRRRKERASSPHDRHGRGRGRDTDRDRDRDRRGGEEGAGRAVRSS